MSALRKVRQSSVAPDAVAPVAAGPSSAAAPTPSGEPMLVDVVVLTADLDLFQSTREAVGERNPVWRARTAEEAADLLITGRCGVLLIDLACVSVRADTLVAQIVEQFPDVVVCVAGTRVDEPALVPMITEGLVYRFMHKPASARRASMFLQAAIRRHVERRAGVAGDRLALPLLRSLAQPGLGLPRRFLVLLGILALAVTVPLFVGDGHDESPASSNTTSEVAATSPIGVDSTVAGPRSDAERADPVLSRARAALQAGRLEAPEGRNALDLFEAVLLAQPDHVEARAGLERTFTLLLERASKQAGAGHEAEAERLLQRVLAVDPDHEAAKALLTRIRPPDSPSRQLAREQLAEARAAASPATEERVEHGSSIRLEPQAITRVPVPVTSPVTSLGAPAVKPRVATVHADPLAPRYTNDPARVGTLRQARNFGGTVANALPTVGMTAGTAQPVVTDEAAARELQRVPADQLDRISARDPVYPAAALHAGTRGWVELEFTITPAGAVRDIQVVGAEPNGVFEGAATDALAQWRFRPRVVNGHAVAQRSNVTIRFDVDG